MIGAVPSQDGLCVYYDQEWNEVSVEQDATYEMKIVFLEENRELTSNITVERGGRHNLQPYNDAI